MFQRPNRFAGTWTYVIFHHTKTKLSLVCILKTNRLSLFVVYMVFVEKKKAVFDVISVSFSFSCVSLPVAVMLF